MTKRVQVLMEPDEFDRLEALARQHHSSVSDLMREAARAHWLAGATASQRSAAARAFLDLPDAELPAWDELEREIEARRG
ncbi:MAG: CopG family transcriptional regulator [Ardenticatenales bacterium]